MEVLSNPVGKNCINDNADVAAVQRLLNARGVVSKISTDGKFGPATLRAILQYQMNVFAAESDWDGRISPKGKTLRLLNDPNTTVRKSATLAEASAQAEKLGGHEAEKRPASAGPADIPFKIVTSTLSGLSGKAWCEEFETSKSTDDLASPFRQNVENFLKALEDAGLKPRQKIAATFRPAERAYLMHWCFKIAHKGQDPRKVPKMTSVNINWVHVDKDGNYDAKASKAAAAAMSASYGIKFQPSLTSRHISGNAIDMTFSWPKTINVTDSNGKSVEIKAGSSVTSAKLHAVGKSYGVIKLVKDQPHWSNNGH